MFRITSPKDNPVSASYLFLKSIGAKVTERTIEETLKNHPNYPSLLAISDSFNEWNVENVAIKTTPEQFSDLSFPLMVHLHVEGGIFVIVKNIKDDLIEWIHPKIGKINEASDDFFNKWSGIALIAEANEQSIEKEYITNRKKEFIENLRIPAIIAGFGIFTLYVLLSKFSNNWHYNATLLTKLLGTILSSLLLWQSIDKNNPFIQNICQAGGKSNCNAILTSNAAQITPWLSWSEVGFFYFSAGFLALIINPNSILFLWILGTMALFYTCWSIYHQAFVAKQWCILCLTIQLTFIIEFFINLNLFSVLKANPSLLNFNDSVSFLQGLALAILFWISLKPILQKSQQVQTLINDLRRFKNNPELFLNLLRKQEEMQFVAPNMNTVILGNSTAEHTITMVTNPFCQPCARTHKQIDKLLERNKNLKCQVIFYTGNHNNEKDSRAIVAETILSLPKNKQAEALHMWNENDEANIEKWKKQLDLQESNSFPNSLKQHQVWCEVSKIKGTPTLYFDGLKLPELYRVNDLNGIINYLPTLDFAKSNI